MGKVKEIKHQNKVHIYYSRGGKVYRRPTSYKWEDRFRYADNIADEISKVQKVVTEHLRLKGFKPSIDYVKNKLGEKQLRVSDLFLDYFKDFLDEKKEEVRPSSLKDYTSWKNSVADYQTYYKIKLTFDNVNLSFGRKYVNFLISTDRPKNAKTTGNLNDTTISKRITSFRSYMKWIESNNIFTFEKKIKAFKPVQNYATDFVSLTTAELTQLYKFKKKTLTKRLEMVRDIFIFGCMTSLRYSDIVTLKPRHISPEFKLVKKSVKGRKGEKYVQFLNPTAIEIWKKYNEDLDRFSNQKFNECIKKVCVLANLFQEPVTKVIMQNGIEVELEPKPKYMFISSHTARRCFITNQVAKGITMNRLMEMTSHKKIDTLIKYIDKSGSTKEDTNNIAL